LGIYCQVRFSNGCIPGGNKYIRVIRIYWHRVIIGIVIIAGIISIIIRAVLITVIIIIIIQVAPAGVIGTHPYHSFIRIGISYHVFLAVLVSIDISCGGIIHIIYHLGTFIRTGTGRKYDYCEQCKV